MGEDRERFRTGWQNHGSDRHRDCAKGRAYDSETAIVTFDVPINSKQLRYIGKKRYVDFDLVLRASNDTKPGAVLDEKPTSGRMETSVLPCPMTLMRANSMCIAWREVSKS
ncbi:MAG: hypothetical protein QM758_21950 [Armatimonas sp.]